MRAIPCCVALMLIGAGCRSASLESLPLTISVEAKPSVAAVGDTVAVFVTVQGNSLIGVEIEFGDGQRDLFGMGGARTGRVAFRHAYAARGSFTAAATVTDATAGQKSSSVGVRVQ